MTDGLLTAISDFHGTVRTNGSEYDPFSFSVIGNETFRLSDGTVMHRNSASTEIEGQIVHGTSGLILAGYPGLTRISTQGFIKPGKYFYTAHRGREYTH
jgi:hypothetical protein